MPPRLVAPQEDPWMARHLAFLDPMTAPPVSHYPPAAPANGRIHGPSRGWSRRLVPFVVLAATLALAPTAGAAFPGRNGLIVMGRDLEDGSRPILTMRPNGHGLTQ